MRKGRIGGKLIPKKGNGYLIISLVFALGMLRGKEEGRKFYTYCLYTTREDTIDFVDMAVSVDTITQKRSVRIACMEWRMGQHHEYNHHFIISSHTRQDKKCNLMANMLM